MFLGLVEEARAIYERHRGKSNDARVLRNFAELRQAGLSHSLMDEVAAWIVEVSNAAPNPDPPPSQSRDPSEALTTPADTGTQQVAAAPLGQIELGDQQWDEGNLAGTLRHYFRALGACRLRLAEEGPDSGAQQDLDLVVPRIGELAFEFLLARDPKQASQAIAQALRDRPQWLRLRLIHAHVLMLSGHISEASRLHSQHFRDPLENEDIWGDAIRGHFAQLRAAGYRSAVMDAWEPKA